MIRKIIRSMTQGSVKTKLFLWAMILLGIASVALFIAAWILQLPVFALAALVLLVVAFATVKSVTINTQKAQKSNKETYDEGKEVSFGLYAKICVNNALISTLRKYKTEQKRQRRAKERENKAPADPIAALINAEDDERLKAKIKTELSDFEKSVFDLYINDKSTREIAEILGREEKSVSNALYRMKVKIKGLLKN